MLTTSCPSSTQGTNRRISGSHLFASSTHTWTQALGQSPASLCWVSLTSWIPTLMESTNWKPMSMRFQVRNSQLAASTGSNCTIKMRSWSLGGLIRDHRSTMDCSSSLYTTWICNRATWESQRRKATARSLHWLLTSKQRWVLMIVVTSTLRSRPSRAPSLSIAQRYLHQGHFMSTKWMIGLIVIRCTPMICPWLALVANYQSWLWGTSIPDCQYRHLIIDIWVKKVMIDILNWNCTLPWSIRRNQTRYGVPGDLPWWHEWVNKCNPSCRCFLLLHSRVYPLDSDCSYQENH